MAQPIYSDTFVADLEEKLQDIEQTDADKIARKAIIDLQAVSQDRVTLRPFNLQELKNSKLSQGVKKDLCHMITKVFVGSYFKGYDKGQLDVAISNLFNHNLSEVVNTVRCTSKILSSVKKLDEPLVERLLQDKKLNQILVDTLGKVPSKEGIQQLLELYDSFKHAQALTHFNELISCLPKSSGTVDLIKKMASLLQTVPNNWIFNFWSNSEDAVMEPKERAQIIQAVKKIPKEQRKEVLTHAIPLMKKDHSTEERIKILQAVKDIPVGEREGVIIVAKRLIEGVSSVKDLAKLLKAAATLPQGNRKEVIKLAKPLMEGIVNVDEQIDLLKAVEKIPAEKRLGVTDHMKPFMNVHDVDIRLAIMKALARIPHDECSEAIRIAMRVMEGIDPDAVAEILEVITDIPQEEREELVEQGIPLLSGTDDGFGKVEILRALGETKRQERQSVVELARPLVKNMQDKEGVAKILNILGKVPSEMHSGLIEEAKLWINKLEDNDAVADKLLDLAIIASSNRGDNE